MYQRVRVAADTLFRELISASGVRPCRWGGSSSDPPGTFRSDTITIVDGEHARTYWLKSDTGAATYQLMSYAGGAAADVPVVDHVVALEFSYFGDGEVPLAPPALSDGPWLPDADAAVRWDADLERVRSIVIAIAVQAASAALRGPAGTLFTHGGSARSARRWAPDVAIRMRVAPRNLNLRT